jgi:hypothetical protein
MPMKSFSGETIEIGENGQVNHLTYQGLLVFHGGEAVWGASVGFRAMQAAGYALSTKQLWDRNLLSIVSAHPGPGVRDAIEYVTRCVSRNRFHLLNPDEPAGCHQDMQFRWWIIQDKRTVEVQLREGFVPPQFFELLGRVDTEKEQLGDFQSLRHLKTNLTKRLWEESFSTLYRVNQKAIPSPWGTVQCMS